VRSETREEKDMIAVVEGGGVVNGGAGRCSRLGGLGDSKIREEWRSCLVCEERMSMIKGCVVKSGNQAMLVVSRTRMKTS
jgi:hypothetical protein